MTVRVIANGLDVNGSFDVTGKVDVIGLDVFGILTVDVTRI